MGHRPAGGAGSLHHWPGAAGAKSAGAGRGRLKSRLEVSIKSKKSVKDGAFEVYRPKGSTSKVKETFRLLGVPDQKSKTYHFYLTNITPEHLSAEDVALLYRARWSIELIFKELKRLYQLDVIFSGAKCLTLRGETAVGEPYEGKLHVRFDEGTAP
ncbi:transposase [Desulfotomaculum copahuensis]|uniref:transposase n=1 Tax=Desulfotomaculum copahuensis TaxID=1838280 RepID=UPI00098F6949